MTVKAGTFTVCLIRLKAERGSCTLTAKKLKPGTYHPIATYPGNANFARSASPKTTLVVTK